MIASAALALGPAVAPAGDDAPNVRLINNSERFAVVKALGGAARALGQPECQALLDEFADGSGRPLRAALEASGLTAPEYLGGVLFYDSPTPLCGGSALAVTKPGNRAVLVCGSRFLRQAGARREPSLERLHHGADLGSVRVAPLSIRRAMR